MDDLDPYLARVLRRVEVDGVGCWIWTASLRDGYGQVRQGGSTRGAHRVVYELLVGDVEPDLDLDHLCRRRHCVNPDHLQPVTRRENLERSPITHVGLAMRGHRVAARHSVLSPSDIPIIRARLAAGDTKAAIARSYGVTAPAIGSIARGRTWTQVA